MSTRFSLSAENEQAGAGQDGRTFLARPSSQARTGTKESCHFPCSADCGQQDWQPYPVDPYSAIIIFDGRITQYSQFSNGLWEEQDKLLIVPTNQLQPCCGERAGWCGTGRPNLSRETKFSGSNGGREIFNFLCSADREQDWQRTRLIHTLLKVLTSGLAGHAPLPALLFQVLH